MNWRRPTFAALLVVGVSCSKEEVPSLAGASAEAWPEADALFHRDPRWLGADGAYSVPLEDGRVLWLFGDTFVATTDAHSRKEAAMPRNTVAVQSGADPLTASMSFYWRGTREKPTSYFAEDGDHWYWPQHGIRIGKALVLFLAHVAPSSEGLGFLGDGWRLAIVDDATAAPDAWSPRILQSTSAPPGIQVGGALVRDGDYVIALAEREPGDHAGCFVRWKAADLAAGNVDAAEWWTHDHGFVAASVAPPDPTIVIADAGPESSLHRDRHVARFVHVRSDGFGATTIVASFAQAVTGPWTQPRIIYRPPESDAPNAFVYAAKAHPELDTHDDHTIAVTYATNALQFADAVANDNLYYPHFVKVWLPD